MKTILLTIAISLLYNIAILSADSVQVEAFCETYYSKDINFKQKCLKMAKNKVASKMLIDLLQSF